MASIFKYFLIIRVGVVDDHNIIYYYYHIHFQTDNLLLLTHCCYRIRMASNRFVILGPCGVVFIVPLSD